jgi:hypothetical protein
MNRPRKSNYHVVPAPKSRCPDGHSVELLCDDGGVFNPQHPAPAFFICFTCKFIGEVGRGPVRREKGVGDAG